jgi:hypothetical protein
MQLQPLPTSIDDTLRIVCASKRHSALPPAHGGLWLSADRETPCGAATRVKAVFATTTKDLNLLKSMQAIYESSAYQYAVFSI